MVDDKNNSIVFEYEPQSIWVPIFKTILVIALIGAAFYGGYITGIKWNKIEPEKEKQLKKKIGDLETSLNKQKNRNKELEELCNDLKSGKEGFVKIRKELKDNIKKLEAKVNSLSEQLKEKNKENKTLEKTISDLKKINSQLSSNNRKQKKQLEEKLSRITQLEESREKNLKQIEGQLEQIKNLNTKINGLKSTNKDIKADLKQEQLRVKRYKKEYERIVAKYDEVRDKYLEEHPSHYPITWMEPQIFTSPDSNYKILLEISNEKEKFVNIELAIYTITRCFPKFDIILFDKNGNKFDRVIERDFSRSGIGAGRVQFQNEGWEVKKGKPMPMYFKINYE